jgi:hypothetical protein
MICPLDEIDDTREDVDISLEDLLIFPNRDGLRRAVDKMASYFALEGEIMRKNIGSFTDGDYGSMIEDQENVAGIAMGELNKQQQQQQQQPASTSTCKSNN